MSRILKLVEQRILNSANDPVLWRLTISSTQSGDLSNDAATWPELPDIDEFRAARVQLFAKLRGDDGNWITQAVNLVPLREEIALYTEKYLGLLGHALRNFETASPDRQRHAIANLQRPLELDTVALNLAADILYSIVDPRIRLEAVR